MEQQLNKKTKIFIFMSIIFVTLLVISNVIAGKIIMIGNLVGPAAVLFYAFTFAISDTLTEIWGKERVKFIILVGFFANLIAAIMIRLAISFPHALFWEYQQEYQLVLGSNFRIVIASMTAYLISQYHDVWSFDFWKKTTDGKHLWLRNNLSTLTSQLIDTILFIIIGFFGTGTPMLTMIVSQYIIKLIIALLDTPLVYVSVNMIRMVTDFDEKFDKLQEVNS